MEAEIRLLKVDEDLPLQLLLLADPSEEIVREYAAKSVQATQASTNCSFIKNADFGLPG